MKICSKCKAKKPLSEFFARKARSNGCGVMSWCKKCFNEYIKQDHKDNPGRRSKIKKRFRAKHLEQCRAEKKLWCKNNPEKCRVTCKRAKTKYRSTPTGIINTSIGNGIRKSLVRNKNLYHWEKLAGYTVEELRKHLESKFTDGMTWENYGKWHIDHVFPLSRLYIDGVDDPTFKFAWSLKNLQPLWAIDNLRKQNYLPDQWAKQKAS